MKVLLIIWVCFFTKICIAQQPLSSEKDNLIFNNLGNSKTLTLNINSKEFIRILDGFELRTKNPVPKNIKINSVRRVSDTLKLKDLKIGNFNKPYMFLSSFASDTRSYIYAKAKIDYELQNINLPIVLNKKLITFDKYTLVDNLDTSRILTAKHIKQPSRVKYKSEMPLGMIEVTYR
ncbi:MAG: hypothetical protein M3Z26_12765 [Bacteroidota bacterium]|nr:hypothetical protein [Bacteroidota bacterium]